MSPCQHSSGRVHNLAVEAFIHHFGEFLVRVANATILGVIPFSGATLEFCSRIFVKKIIRQSRASIQVHTLLPTRKYRQVFDSKSLVIPSSLKLSSTWVGERISPEDREKTHSNHPQKKTLIHLAGASDKYFPIFHHP